MDQLAAGRMSANSCSYSVMELIKCSFTKNTFCDSKDLIASSSDVDRLTSDAGPVYSQCLGKSGDFHAYFSLQFR